MDIIGIYAVPFILIIILICAIVRKTDIFGAFCSGAKEGITAMFSIAPSLVGLIVAVGMLTASGFFDIAAKALSPVFSAIGFPAELLPLALVRPVSGSGSLAVLSSILEKYGADSFIGMTASVMAGSTDTTFYAIAVYYGYAGIKKSGCTLPCALAADLFSMFFSILTVRMIY